MDAQAGGNGAGAVGHFTYVGGTGTWWWSDGMYELYGYTPGEVPPSAELLSTHKHPDDAARANRAREEAMRTGGVYSCYHRIIDRAGKIRSVHTVARSSSDASGRVDRLEGFCVDLTTARRAETEVEVQSALAAITEHRAVIDRAIGMVMLATGCTGVEAFECLARYSQNANLKLHGIAQRLVDTVELERGGTDVVIRVLAELVAPLRGRVADPTH